MLSAACLVTAILGEWLAIVPAILSGVSAGGAWQQIKREKTT